MGLDRRTILGTAAALAGSSSMDLARAQETGFSLAVTADLGADRGQNFGTLFEARDGQGRLIATAGFPALYNTRFRMDRHAVQFCVFPLRGGFRPTLTRVPRPDDDAGLYLFDHDGRIYASNDSNGRGFSEWDPAKGAWGKPTGAVAGLMTQNDGVCRAGGGLLRFINGQVEFEGRVVLPRPTRGSYNHFYFAQGRLFFYHTVRLAGGGFTELVAAPWDPTAGDPIDLDRAVRYPIQPLGMVTWAWGQHANEVLTVSNWGGVYAFRDGAWRTLREHSPGVSYQVYSMLTAEDRLLLGQYPTGEIFAYDGKSLTHLPGSPPRMPLVSSSARECQTLGVYAGRLWAGVWPWGEVWSRPAAGGEWQFADRLFSHPTPTEGAVHPYEKECLARGLVVNDWGQRVTSMTAVGDSLYLATSAKGNHRWDPRFDFMTAEQRKEYGAVVKMRIPGCLTTPIRWKPRAIRLSFDFDGTRLSISQDGDLLARCSAPELSGLVGRPVQFRLQSGIFGPSEPRNVIRSSRIL